MNRTDLVNSTSELFELITYCIENNKHFEERLLTSEMSRNKEYKNLSLSLTEWHLISHIGSNNGSNGVNIARDLKITKGGISKAAKKLLQKNILYTEKLPNNRKEVYYQLTSEGQNLYRLHDNMHKKANEEFLDMLDIFTDYDLTVIIKFLNEIYKNFDKR